MFCIYLHIPFCQKICDYCDFRVMPLQQKLLQEYAALLCHQILCYEKENPGVLETAETLYLGGGTPSLLPAPQLRQIFECLQAVGVKLGNLREISMEFNPESTSLETVEAACGLGVNRISLGIQTFDGGLLKRVGRSHSVEMGLHALDLLTSKSSLQVSADLMFNLPGQTLDGFLKDVDLLSEYSLNHISFYGLGVSPRTRLGHQIAKGLLQLDEDLYEPMYQGGVELLDSKGFKRYEVSNFAKTGFESIHNLNYWNRGEYVGFGPGAHSFCGEKRFYAPEIYPRWRDFVKKGCPVQNMTVDALDEEGELMEVLWLSLRQSKGLSLAELEKQGVKLQGARYDKWVEKGFLAVDKRMFQGRIETWLRLEGRGWIFMDDIVTDLANAYSKLE